MDIPSTDGGITATQEEFFEPKKEADEIVVPAVEIGMPLIVCFLLCCELKTNIKPNNINNMK